jgi:sigma-E factor negative regulatory protein RseA
MDNKTTMHDKISAFADGELPHAQVDAVMKDLATPEGRAAWEAYHHAGDVMRSDDMDVALSPGFSARMAARLDAEPTVLAPPSAVPVDTGQQAASRFCLRRFAAPALGAAAVAALAFILTPSVLKSLNVAPADQVQAVASAASASVSHASVIAAAAPASAGGAIALRASDLDAYVQAHQPASPAVDGAAQFVSPDVPGSTAAK